MRATLLLVTGAGRSGTSTMAGALHHLGVHVPGPFLDANPSNPKGFFESRWSVRFHNRLLRRANVGLADGRPEALARVRDAVRAKDRDAMRDHLARVTDGAPLTVVKDPRATWTLDLWREVGDELGLRVATVAMLRHPAEVVGSRATHYAGGVAVLGEAGYAIHNCAGWVNAMLTTERQTREAPRAFVRYDALLGDWRREVARLLGVLDLPAPAGVDLSSRAPHPVDEFVDPGLSRHRLTWSDVPLPHALRTVAEETWQACAALAGEAPAGAPADDEPAGGRAPVEAPVEAPAEALAAVDEARAHYEALYAESRALVHDAIVAEVKTAQRAADRRASRGGREARGGRGPAGGGAAGEPAKAKGLTSRLRRPR